MEDIDFVHKEMSGSEKDKFEKGVRSVYLATQLLHKTISGWVKLSERTPLLLRVRPRTMSLLLKQPKVVR